MLTHDQIARLTPDERLVLIAQLWDSLDDHQVQLTPAQQVELERRLATLDHDRSQSVTWETLKEELEQCQETIAAIRKQPARPVRSRRRPVNSV